MSDDSEPTEAWEDHWLEPTEDWNDNYNKFKEQDGAGIAIAVITLVVGKKYWKNPSKMRYLSVYPVWSLHWY